MDLCERDACAPTDPCRPTTPTARSTGDRVASSAIMHTYRALTRSLVFVGLVGMSGCGGGGASGPIPADRAPAEFGGALCHLMFDECDCTRVKMLIGSEQTCSDAYADQLEMYFAEAQAAGLVYNADCMGEFLDLYTQTIACSTRSELVNDVLTQLQVPTCKVHSGTAAVGEACTSYYQALGDSCVQGLQCLGGTCMQVVAPRDPKLAGEVCDFQTDLCEEGTTCLPSDADPAGPGSCVRGPGANEPCVGFCDVGLRCDYPAGGSERVCLQPPGEGEDCAFAPYECAEGLRCSSGVCNVGLPEGAECEGDDSCALGLECENATDGGPEVCQLEDAFVCI